MHRPHKYSEAHSNGTKKCNKTFESDSNVKETNIMEYDAPIPKKNKEKNSLKSARVKAPKQIQKSWKILILLTT